MIIIIIVVVVIAVMMIIILKRIMIDGYDYCDHGCDDKDYEKDD
jgi:hypothetical protein